MLPYQWCFCIIRNYNNVYSCAEVVPSGGECRLLSANILLFCETYDIAPCFFADLCQGLFCYRLLENAHIGGAGFVLGFVDKRGVKIIRVTRVTRIFGGYIVENKRKVFLLQKVTKIYTLFFIVFALRSGAGRRAFRQGGMTLLHRRFASVSDSGLRLTSRLSRRRCRCLRRR